MNQRGSAILVGLLVALAVGIVTTIIFQQSQLTDKQTRLPRVKSALVQTELKLRQALASAASYQSCTVNGTPSFCLKPGVADSFKKPVIGADCPASKVNCGVVVEDLQVVAGQATGKIVYEGVEANVEPMALELTVPPDVMVSSTVCPDPTPIFLGWNSNGTPRCSPLPPDCGPGQYISELNGAELQMGSGARICRGFPAVVGCANPTSQYISNFAWNGGTNVVVTCRGPVDAFTVFGDPTNYNYIPEPSWPTPTTVTMTTTTTVTSTTGTTTTTTGTGTTTTTLPGPTTTTSSTSTTTITVLPSTTTMTLPPTTLPVMGVWRDTGVMGSYGQSDAVCGLPACTSYVGACPIGPSPDVDCVTAAQIATTRCPGCCCSTPAVCVGNHRVYACLPP